ncbi:MAG: ATP-binding protein [Thermodesulfobacteriota bacterium]
MPDARILIVEDEGIEAMDIQQRLMTLGYPSSDIAFSGEEAVQKAEEMRPDLVLMDIMLPGEIDGVKAAEQIQASLDIPIIYLTAYADEDTLQRAKITEPYGYIVKPFKERELHITIDMALYKHKMEKTSKERERWVATTLRSIGDAVIATDKDGFILLMNPIAENLTGWKLKDALNNKLTEVFSIINRDTREIVENPVEKVIREGNIVGLGNHTRLIARDGREIPIDDSAAPIRDDKGNLIGVVLVFRDMTEREKAEDALRRAHDELEQRVRERTAELRKTNEELEQRNRDLEDFVHVASHDLQEPARKVQTFADLLTTLHQGSMDAKANDYLERMQQCAARMQALILDLLRYSRATSMPAPFTAFSLKDPVKEAMEDLGVLREEANGTIQVGELPEIVGNLSQMHQLFQNLISNALKFRSERAPVVKVYEASPPSSPFWKIHVQDNGIGFGEEFLEKIFKPFQRLHGRESPYEGTGIGLAICRRIVERHGGNITAESVPGQGATFIVRLPKKNKM